MLSVRISGLQLERTIIERVRVRCTLCYITLSQTGKFYNQQKATESAQYFQKFTCSVRGFLSWALFTAFFL